MSQYNYPNSSISNVDGLVRYFNVESGGILVPFYVLISYCILILIMIPFGFANALMTSTIVVTIIMSMLSIAGFVSPTYVYAGIALSALFVLFARLSK